MYFCFQIPSSTKIISAFFLIGRISEILVKKKIENNLWKNFKKKYRRLTKKLRTGIGWKIGRISEILVKKFLPNFVVLCYSVRPFAYKGHCENVFHVVQQQTT